jgi:hypothetical protein
MSKLYTRGYFLSHSYKICEGVSPACIPNNHINIAVPNIGSSANPAEKSTGCLIICHIKFSTSNFRCFLHIRLQVVHFIERYVDVDVNASSRE